MILRQFLVESILLSLFGAIIGLVLTSGIAWFKQSIIDGLMSGFALVGLADPDTSVNLSFLSNTIPFGQILIALFVATFVGVLAGIIPAFRASRLDPVEALRAE
jgi:putative ABC transport system permease protein